MKFSSEDKQLIVEEIMKAERKTSGEIVPVIVRQSDQYSNTHFKSAIITSMIFLVLVYHFDYTFNDSIYFLYAFAIGSILGYLLSFIPIIKRLLLTNPQLEEEFKQRAYQAFLLNGVTQTKNRNGVLLFISAFERRAMILADSGIQEKIDNKVWETIITGLTTEIKEKKYTKAITLAISSIGDILEEHFPYSHNEEDELPNKLIIDV